MKLPFRIMLLDDDQNALEGMTELLRNEGYAVTPVATYDAAKRLITESSFDLFISDVRLRGYNGLHLVMHCRQTSPEMGVIIMTGYDERMMQLEASRYQAEFIRKPVKPEVFLETVGRALARVRRQRRWPRKRVLGGFKVTAHGHSAAVTEVGYGGLRLEVPTSTLPQVFEVEVTGIGLRLTVEPVWSFSSQTGALVCGAALTSDTTPEASTWRTIVDRLTA